jgi:hypothetical protein
MTGSCDKGQTVQSALVKKWDRRGLEDGQGTKLDSKSSVLSALERESHVLRTLGFSQEGRTE